MATHVACGTVNVYIVYIVRTCARVRVRARTVRVGH